MMDNTGITYPVAFNPAPQKAVWRYSSERTGYMRIYGLSDLPSAYPMPKRPITPRNIKNHSITIANLIKDTHQGLYKKI